MFYFMLSLKRFGFIELYFSFCLKNQLIALAQILDPQIKNLYSFISFKIRLKQKNLDKNATIPNQVEESSKELSTSVAKGNGFNLVCCTL